MDITERQKDLLRLLVSKNEEHGGAEFIFTRGSLSSGLTYPGAPGVSHPYDLSDFHQLRNERLIALEFVSQNVHRGKPTQRGIDLVRSDVVSDTDLVRPPDSSVGGMVTNSTLPALTSEARERIARALGDARGHLKGAPDDKNTAVLHYFDAMAWEYLSITSAAEFELLIGVISEHAESTFDGDSGALRDRKIHWVLEARERAANGIVCDKIPIRINPKQAPIFQSLQIQFRDLPSGARDLQAMFTDGGQSEIRPGPNDPSAYLLLRRQYERLARRAMAALGFSFVDPSRAAHYWLDLMRQESPHPNQWRISLLCFASAEFCAELETRALEATALTHTEEDGASIALPVVSSQIADQCNASKPVRLRATITSPIAARRMEAYITKGLGQTEFANQVGTTDRTLRSFRKSGKIRRDIFDAIAKAMGTTRDELLKPE